MIVVPLNHQPEQNRVGPVDMYIIFGAASMNMVLKECQNTKKQVQFSCQK